MANQTDKEGQADPLHRIDVRQAVKIALNSFYQLYPKFKDKNVMLEEMEQSEDSRYWLITIGFDTDSTRPLNPMLSGTLGSSLFPPRSRSYKKFKIEARTGKVVAMTIRTLN